MIKSNIRHRGALTFRCTRPSGRRTGRSSLRSGTWRVGRTRQSPKAAVSVAELPPGRWRPDTWCALSKWDESSTRCPNSRPFRLWAGIVGTLLENWVTRWGLDRWRMEFVRLPLIMWHFDNKCKLLKRKLRFKWLVPLAEWHLIRHSVCGLLWAPMQIGMGGGKEGAFARPKEIKRQIASFPCGGRTNRKVQISFYAATRTDTHPTPHNQLGNSNWILITQFETASDDEWCFA